MEMRVPGVERPIPQLISCHPKIDPADSNPTKGAETSWLRGHFEPSVDLLAYAPARRWPFLRKRRSLL